MMFSGKEQVQAFQMIVVANAMRLYIKTGIKANRDYTPKNMLALAASWTGKTYKRNALTDAYNDLREAFPEMQFRPL